MSTCGYICPQCEGTGFLENGVPCDWCTPENNGQEDPEITGEETEN